MPENIASLVNVPGKLLVGGGITHAQEMFIRNDETNKVPETFGFDGMISYEIDRYRFAINGHNLTDELYDDSYFQVRTRSRRGRRPRQAGP